MKRVNLIKLYKFIVNVICLCQAVLATGIFGGMPAVENASSTQGFLNVSRVASAYKSLVDTIRRFGHLKAQESKEPDSSVETCQPLDHDVISQKPLALSDLNDDVASKICEGLAPADIFNITGVDKIINSQTPQKLLAKAKVARAAYYKAIDSLTDENIKLIMTLTNAKNSHHDHDAIDAHLECYIKILNAKNIYNRAKNDFSSNFRNPDIPRSDLKSITEQFDAAKNMCFSDFHKAIDSLNRKLEEIGSKTKLLKSDYLKDIENVELHFKNFNDSFYKSETFEKLLALKQDYDMSIDEIMYIGEN